MINFYAAALTCLMAIPAHADMPPRQLIAVRIHMAVESLSTDYYYSTATLRGRIIPKRISAPTTINLPKTLEGYFLWSSADPAIAFTSATATEQLSGYRGKVISFWKLTDVFEVKHPHPALVSSTSLRGMLLPISAMTRVEKISAPFDGRTLEMHDLQFISPEQAALRSNKKPIYFCQVYGGEMAEEILVSYNPAWNEDRMKPLCTKNHDQSAIPVSLTEEEIAAFVKDKNVFIIYVPVD